MEIKEITIRYSKNGKPVSDFEIENKINKLKNKEEFHTSNHAVILYARVLHKQGKIKLTLFVDEKPVGVDINGNIESYEGICDNTIYYSHLI